MNLIYFEGPSHQNREKCYASLTSVFKCSTLFIHLSLSLSECFLFVSEAFLVMCTDGFNTFFAIDSERNSLMMMPASANSIGLQRKSFHSNSTRNSIKLFGICANL